MRAVAAILLGVVLLGACSDGTPEVTLPPPAEGAEEAVTRWLDAVGRVDLDELRVVVEPRGVAILLGLENRLDGSEMLALIDQGVPEETLQSYWSSFRADFEAFALDGIATIDLGTAFPFTVRDQLFAAVPATGAEGGTTEIIAAEVNGYWRVDFMATFGPGFVRALGSFFADDTAVVRSIAAMVNVPLRAGMSREPGDEITDELAAEIDVLLVRLDDLVNQ
ncbi:MAG: hypothetical protein KJN71_01015 [Acidimicrobiia bacterium]|nr:hypothetical protein [Acidimicrobiia bacterium]NNC74100.1 hypothetical protein [Acidimicrobiia bacterium]